jgi:hypothetical protein
MKQLRRMNRIPEARMQMTRLIKAYYLGEIEPVTFRNLVYGLSTLLAFQRAELDQELEKRLDAIEEKLQ